MVKTIDILGLKNFRIFEDQNGFFEEFAAINILTGANNSGKSSIVKALQMLKNSTKGYRYPFDLDLNQQEHLLGDFDNILFDKSKKQIDISLPFLFFGITNLFVSLTFNIPDSPNPYKAHLRSIEVFDKIDKQILFSFKYRNAADDEKGSDKILYEKNLKIFKEKEIEIAKLPAEEAIFSNILNQPPDDNPLIAWVEWRINLEKLKDYLGTLQPFYEKYLENQRNWDDEQIEEMDQRAEDKKVFFIPSAFFKWFKNDLDPQKWKEFIGNFPADKKEISGNESVRERDFDQEEAFLLKPEIEHNLYHKAENVLQNNLAWEDGEKENTYPVIAECFRMSWDKLIQRVSSINYISNIKEENARGYNSTSNSPFINLLKEYLSSDIDAEFLEKYLKAFEIGRWLTVEFQPKYQLLLVSINTLNDQRRELVDFGYGIKQIILILIQVSVLAKQNKRVEQRYTYDGDVDHITYEPCLLIIEEPESNLHPKWQSLLADMLSEASRRFNIQLIIETHSEYLIRKFQTLVAKKIVKAQDVKIFYLRNLQTLPIGKKQVESLSINENGSIDFNLFDSGFFDESYNLNTSLLNIQFYKEFEDLKNANQEGEAKIQETEAKLHESEAKVQEGETMIQEGLDKIQEHVTTINTIQQKIDEWLDQVDINKYRQNITIRFPNHTKLDSLSLDYLVGGQYLLANMDNNPDYSPVIMQYGRAIENELKRIFNQIDPAESWMIGPMQKLMEKFQTPSKSIKAQYNAAYGLLAPELNRQFNVPENLKIDLINNLREIRNSAGHAGHTKSQQDANAYITKANDFLDKWIAEKK
jgi:AAA15 family ATPase/GTPase